MSIVAFFSVFAVKMRDTCTVCDNIIYSRTIHRHDSVYKTTCSADLPTLSPVSTVETSKRLQTLTLCAIQQFTSL